MKLDVQLCSSAAISFTAAIGGMEGEVKYRMPTAQKSLREA
jgi:hypothetical protein